MSKYTELTARKQREHGDRFDASDLHSQFIPYFNSGDRIRVANGEYVRTGRVGVTTGWKPAFLLMHRASDHGSSDVLGPDDQITHVQRGRVYVPVPRS